MKTRPKSYKKYPFRQIKPGDKIVIPKGEQRRAQLTAWYYRSLSKRPINLHVLKDADGYHWTVL